jgi:hypothetical protein
VYGVDGKKKPLRKPILVRKVSKDVEELSLSEVLGMEVYW